MDSMRSLNTSLPSSTPTTQPPELLLQAFKTAALSVTNLYKNAVSDQAQSRHLGYQDALEDLRAFLDKERLGNEDGEASRIRSWVMERIDGTGTSASESDDDRSDSDKRHRSNSPVAVRKASHDNNNQTNQQPRSSSPPRSEVPHQPQPSSTNESVAPRQPTFTFSAGPQFPTPQQQQDDVDMKVSDTVTPIPADSRIASPHLTSPSVRVEVLPRGPRTPHRMANSNRHGNRSLTRDTNQVTGSKRKLQFGDFFDISNLGNGRDMFGGGKRGRFM